ncbi:hypothetical protein scyTo_0011498 [Scyliorhinus torazame]|uniref:JmjC domain-containing protein n=1 Tax=Scyliorhinus torazame TaxID=75743 RepID=A0A401NP58_SCYTO|nr:hypothetical protein [Scyliorhinus torazame]
MLWLDSQSHCNVRDLDLYSECSSCGVSHSLTVRNDDKGRSVIRPFTLRIQPLRERKRQLRNGSPTPRVNIYERNLGDQFSFRILFLACRAWSAALDIQLYQDDIDSLSPVLRDNPPLHEEVKAWVKEQKVQEIFMQGPYSLNGYRVRVYRQDSATQWFTGIITYHDLLSRTMIVMNDQVLEPQNVDPSMVQMTFLDDVVHSLLKGENIGITSRRRSRSNQNSPAVHGHYTRAQANSPRPMMNSQITSGKQNQQQQRINRSNKRKESDSSIPEEDKIKEDKCENPVKEESSKNKTKQSVNKRRKQEEGEKQATLERLKDDNISDTESSESENSIHKVILDSSFEQSSEMELKTKITSDDTKDEGESQFHTGTGEQMVLGNSTPCDETQEVKKHSEMQELEPADKKIDLQRTEFGHQQSIKSHEITRACIIELKTTSESVCLEHSPDAMKNATVQKSISDISLSMTSSKWVHPENPLSTEASLRRNASSPWLPQHTTVTSADSLGLLSHIPVRPASAEPHRRLKLASHSSPPLSKATVDHQKEEIDKIASGNSKHLVTAAQMKLEFNHDRHSHGLESQLARGFTSTAFCQSKETRSPQEQSESHNKYNEERRRILQESIEVARFASTIKINEVAKDAYSRIPSLPADGPKSQSIKQDRETEHCAIEFYTSKNSVPHSMPQSNYFTTLSNSVVNEPPRLYLSKDTVHPYAEKTNSSTPTLLSYNKTLSKPPPLIKHHPESEGLVGKITEQFSHQVTSQPTSSNNIDHGRTREQLSISPSNPLRGMPSLHRAPVYQSSSHHVTERREGNYRNLSPPTLTPIQPVNAAKISELQKPPTLLPEPRAGGKICVHNPAIASLDVWKTGKPVCHLENKCKVAPASVIVKPHSIARQENKVEMQTNSKHSGGEGLLMQSNPVDDLKASKIKEVWRTNLPTVNLDTTGAEHEKNFKALLPDNNSKSVAVTNLCNSRTDPSASAAPETTILSGSETNVTYCSSYTTLTNSVTGHVAPKTSTHFGSQIQECRISTTSTAVLSTATARTGSATQNNTGVSNTIDYYQLKKHKAALAMAHSGSTTAHSIESASPKSEKSAASLSPNNTGTIDVPCKANSVTNGQTIQSSYHTKLKKAWLTRHSEEDKNTSKVENTETTGKDTKNLIPVHPLASTSNDVHKTGQSEEEKNEQEERKTRRGTKRIYESGSESDASDESENKSEHRVKRKPKPTYKKRQNDLQKRKADTEKEEEEVKPYSTVYRNTKEKEKNKIKLQSDGLPRSVLKDWRKVKKLKQTGEPFLQDGSCSEIAPNLQKCRECRMVRYRKNEEFNQSAVFCRFYYFRRLAFSKNAVLRVDGFSTPDQYDDEAINLWLPSDSTNMDLDIGSSKYILRTIGEKFYQMETSEKTAMNLLKPDAKIAWKRAVKGVQEMCDACEATLFNIHWVCQKCGFVVCLDCYEAREKRSSKADKEFYVWLKCVKGQVHDSKTLMPTQIIPDTVLTDIGDMMRSIKDIWEIARHDPSTSEQSVQFSKLFTTNGVSQSVLNRNTIISVAKQRSACENPKTNGSSNNPENDITTEKIKELPVSKAVKIELSQVDKEDCKTTTVCLNHEHGSTLRDLLTSTAGKLQLGSTDAGIAFAPVFSAGTPTSRGARSMPNLLDDIIASVVENKIPASKSVKLSCKEGSKQNSQGETKKLNIDMISKSHSEIPHSWLCDGFLLWLQDPGNPSNWKIFRECWRQDQPVLVSGVHKKLNSNIWKPESFCEEFGDQKVDLVNYKDGSIISSVRIQDFWDGFEDLTKRFKSKCGESMLLKLKDWPSGEDFRTTMPSRFDDLMKNLPLPEYCDPEGNLNLASRLPNFFVRPDLGPRLYSAYGQSTVKEHGTINLHLDIADVFNVLVYIGVPKGNANNHRAAILTKIEEDEIDENTKKRLKDGDETPGALWHIFSAKDTNKIRTFLQKANEDQGQESLEHDSIRDHTCYLNKKLRLKLYKECGIRSWSIFQFLGDALLIPAGALRQVIQDNLCQYTSANKE